MIRRKSYGYNLPPMSIDLRTENTSNGHFGRGRNIF